jgi:nicotinate-nucleotide adenylyltransferase
VRIGIFGGSFDPVHRGHLAVAEAARGAFRLDRIVFVPAATPPHKGARELAPAADRLEMVRLALAGRKGFEISPVEVERGGISFTVDTVDELRAREGRPASFVLLVGSDSLLDLPSWKDVHRLLREVEIVAVHRRGAPRGAIERLRGVFSEEEIARIERGFLDIAPVDVSATEVRERVRAGRSIRDLVPEPVADYIERHGLYR